MIRGKWSIGGCSDLQEELTTVKTTQPICRATSAAFFLIIAGGLLAGAPSFAAEGRLFHVRDFGAVPNGKTDSGSVIRAAIAAAMDAAKTAGSPVEVVLEAGTYRVQPERPRGVCFPLHQTANLTVRGAGEDTKIVITDPAAGGFSFGLCQKVCVADLVVDYDPVPFCQGTIRAVELEAGSFDLEVETGYPTPDAENFVEAVEPYGKWGMIMTSSRTRRAPASSSPTNPTGRKVRCRGTLPSAATVSSAAAPAWATRTRRTERRSPCVPRALATA
jgi:hypothetical protein